MSMNGICAMKGNVMQYFKPDEQIRMMYYSVMTQANSEKEIPSAPIRSRTKWNLHKRATLSVERVVWCRSYQYSGRLRCKLCHLQRQNAICFLLVGFALCGVSCGRFRQHSSRPTSHTHLRLIAGAWPRHRHHV